MIPISRDQKIKNSIDGVIYSFHPPVGDLEIDLISTFDAESDIDLKPYYKKAAAELEREYKGKRKPKKERWEKLIVDRIKSYTNTTDNMKNQLKSMNTILNMGLCGWVSKKKIPAFPKENPADLLPIELKRRLFEWYWGQFNLDEDEVKK